MLATMNIREVRVVRIYPQVNRRFGNPAIFRVPDPLITSFFEAFHDVHMYWPSHDTVASPKHAWYLEVATKNIVIQISCNIPSGKGNIAVGRLGKFTSTSTVTYGNFQSELLYQWYQQYSHRWLELENKE